MLNYYKTSVITNIIDIYFTILVVVVVVVVVVVQFNTHNSLTGLAISTKLCDFSYEDVHRHIK